MLPSDYIYEKACYAAEALAGIAEELRHVNAESGARRDVSRYLHVAIRHAVLSLCTVCRARMAPEWVLGILRGGRRFWEDTVKEELEESLSGPSGQRPVPGDEVLDRFLKTCAALLDLREALRKHDVQAPPGFSSNLAYAFNGVTKVVSTVLNSEWDYHWPTELEQKGRAVLEQVLATWNRGESDRPLGIEHLGRLDEVDLVEMDPDRTPEMDREEEQRRRRAVTEENYISGDLVVPPRYRNVDIERLADSSFAAHRECVAYARDPQGSLVLKGLFRSGLHWIKWAIGRYWFAERLETVAIVDWHHLVESNLFAQRRSLWNVPRMLLSELVPIHLEDDSLADPGHADRLLAYRLEQGLPVLFAAEFGLDHLNLRPETMAVVRGAKTIELPELTEPDLASLGMER